jgi:hypothetical protein
MSASRNQRQRSGPSSRGSGLGAIAISEGSKEADCEPYPKMLPLSYTGGGCSHQAEVVGFVNAAGERSAIEEAVKEFKISGALRNRIAGQREGSPAFVQAHIE